MRMLCRYGSARVFMFNCCFLQSAPTPGSTSAPAGEEGEIEEVEDGELKDDDDSDDQPTPHNPVQTVFDNRQVCYNVCCQRVYVSFRSCRQAVQTHVAPFRHRLDHALVMHQITCHCHHPKCHQWSAARHLLTINRTTIHADHRDHRVLTLH